VLFGLSRTYSFISFKADFAESISAIGKKTNFMGCLALLLIFSLRSNTEKTCICEQLKFFSAISCFRRVLRTLTNWLR